LEWLHQHNIEFDKQVYPAAIAKKDIRILDWLFEHGAPRFHESSFRVSNNREVADWFDKRISQKIKFQCKRNQEIEEQFNAFFNS
jgi:hypothetical protein